MKKVFALILALCMVFALCACGQTAAPAATEAPAADTAADAAPAESTGWAPDGPVTMIVSYKAGNGTDVTARVLAQYAEKYIGQTVVIENVDGGSGSLGWSQLAAADPDGMTIG
ncbi:MAG: tripartite tricarboxylate transporter substrate binding protein, partial [Clostridiales bacterium]|nr:tripartite tricarboxylate transporter substrate binding protein [Clostridiales bacterium]